MQTSQLAPAPAPQSDEFVRRALEKASRQLKVVDFLTAVMLMIAVTLGYLLALTLVDHWLFPLGTAVRVIALLVLGAGLVYLAGVMLAPLVIRQVNPTYAARMIEQSQADMKNSLINYLLLRPYRASLRGAVYHALSNKAATDLSQVNIESAIDRSKLIYIGYALAAVMAFSVAYKIFSPKDPFTSFARVLAPWADINRPSRVQVDDILPGDAEITIGTPLEISAKVSGIRETEKVRVIYTTVDRRVVDREVEMIFSASGRYVARLPEGAAPGVEQNLVYRLEAGDFRSREYEVFVVPAPSISVEKLEYRYPAYMRRTNRTLAGQADISAPEGTEVVIHALANQPIRSAYAELFKSDQSPQPKHLPLVSSGQNAQGSLPLKLTAGGTGEFSSYQLRFVNENDDRSYSPIEHQIEVIPDLPPEVAILQPDQKRIDLPADGSLTVEVRGLDPDYGLSRLYLQFESGESQAKSEMLLEDAPGWQGQAVRRFDISPRKAGYRPGQEVRFWGVAEDNRTPVAGRPEPNSTRTETYVLRILPPENPEQQGESDEVEESEEKSEEQQNQAGEKGGEGEEGQEGEESGESESGEGEGEGEEQGAEGESAGEEGESGNMGDPQSQGENGSGEGEPQEGAEGNSKGADGNQQGEGESDEGNSEGNSKGQPQENGNSAGNKKEAGEESEGEGAEGSQQSGGKNGSNSKPGGDPVGEPEFGEGGEGEGEPLHDGELFERALEHLKSQGKLPEQKKEVEGSSPKNESGEKGNDPSGESQSGNKSGGEESEQPSAEGNQQGEGNNPSGQKPAPGEAESSKGSGQNQSAADQGGDSQGQATPGEKEKPNGDSGEQQQSGQGSEGQSGAGQDTESKSGAGEAQGENKDRPKSQNSSGGQSEGEEAQSPSGSPKQSDSQGGESGDRSGGGKQGPGQGANQAGNDTAGSNSAADSGAGAAEESGQGETSSAAGQSQKAQGQTGEAGSEKGNGSQSQQGGSEAGGSTPPSSPGSDEKSSGGESAGGDQGGSDPTGGGGQATNFGAPRQGGPIQQGDAINLEYANKATNLVLDYLKHNQENPDPELLDKLKMSPEQLQEFVSRWESMRRAAKSDATAQEELNQSLQSLGLTPTPNRANSSGSERKDDFSRVSTPADLSKPPAQYQDLFDAFNRQRK